MSYEEIENAIEKFTNGQPINKEIPIENTGVKFLFPNEKPESIKETHVPGNLLVNKDKFNCDDPEEIIQKKSFQKILDNIEEIILNYGFNRLDKPIYTSLYSTETHYYYHMLLIRD